jgi:hypothetical protein
MTVTTPATTPATEISAPPPISLAQKRNEALRNAWLIYLVLGQVPALLAIVGIWVGLLAGSSDEWLSNLFMLLGFAWLTVAIPAGLLYMRLKFNNYYKGRSVSPRNYLLGLLPLWVAMVLGGAIGMFGWIVSRTPLPAVMPSVIAFVVFLVFHPTGHAMTRPVGDSDDPAVYEEPS